MSDQKNPLFDAVQLVENVKDNSGSPDIFERLYSLGWNDATIKAALEMELRKANPKLVPTYSGQDHLVDIRYSPTLGVQKGSKGPGNIA